MKTLEYLLTDGFAGATEGLLITTVINAKTASKVKIDFWRIFIAAHKYQTYLI